MVPAFVYHSYAVLYTNAESVEELKEGWLNKKRNKKEEEESAAAASYVFSSSMSK